MWAAEKKLPPDDREALEIAAVLHDIGKIGLPDHILLKGSKLDDDEQATVDRHRLMGVEILSSCCDSFKVLDIVCNAPAWFNGRRLRLLGDGQSLPLGAGMLAIADAYDSMTTSQVYRPARSHERRHPRALRVLGHSVRPRACPGVRGIYRGDVSRLQADVERRWLDELDPTTVNLHWQLNRNFARTDTMPQQLFQERLLDNMYDAVIFVDVNRQIMLWNRGAERLTGIDAASAYQRIFEAELINLRTERGDLCNGDECPATTAPSPRACNRSGACWSEDRTSAT